MPQTKPETRAGNERNILAAAAQAFAQNGFRGATVQEIADLAELPKANVLYYFGSKAALYHRVVKDIFEVWLHAAEAFEKGETPREAVAHYIRRKMELARSNPFGSKIWANEILNGAPHMSDEIRRELRRWTDDRCAVLQRWIDAGALRPVEPRWLLYMIWASTQHYADFSRQIELLNDDSPLSDEQWRRATDAVISIVLDGALAGGGDE